MGGWVVWLLVMSRFAGWCTGMVVVVGWLVLLRCWVLLCDVSFVGLYVRFWGGFWWFCLCDLVFSGFWYFADLLVLCGVCGIELRCLP